MPTTIASRARSASASHCQARAIQRERPYQMRTAAADPQVPGPGRSLPRPKNVAITLAHNGAGTRAGAVCVVFTSVFVGIIRRAIYAVGNVLHWRSDHILSAGPFA